MASEVLAVLSREGIDCLRNASVREALKRLVKHALDGLASRYPTPAKVHCLNPSSPLLICGCTRGDLGDMVIDDII